MGRGRPARVRGCALALAVLSLATLSPAATPALAASDPAIPPECGTRQAFDAELVKRLGPDVPLDTINVAITQGPAGFHLRVQIGPELRELDDENCQELFRAAVVVAVAMLLHEPTPSEPAGPEPAPAPAPAASSSPRPRFTLAAGAGVSVGLLPPPVFTVELETKALWRYFGLGLSARYLAPGEKLDSAGRGVRLQALGGGVTGIFRPSSSWEARLGFATQRLFGEGLNASVPTFVSQEGAAWTAGPTLGLAYVPLEQPPFWLGLGAEGQLNVLRGHFEILNYSGNIYDVPWLSAAAFVRLGLVW